MKRIRIIIAFLLITIAILALLRLEVTQRLNNNTGKVYTQNREIEALKNENTALRVKVLEESSLTVIATKAAAMGMVPGHKTYIINHGK